MLSVRRRLAWVACGWLACQLAGVVAAPVVLWHLAASNDDRDCDCPVAPGQACPMHHGGNHEGRQDTSTCHLRNAFPTSDAALLSLSGGSGILPRPTTTVSVFDAGAVVLSGTPSAVLRVYRPESPPPRA
jgi:hypothetical protein